MGMRIHAIRRDEAKQAADAGNAMGWSAEQPHRRLDLRIGALLEPGCSLLACEGRYVLGIDYFGRLLGFGE